ncbi:MAG TPA: GNAT family N-acetyltransferase [Rhodocyclaceae bacterium]|nr:GNAT family N-acetyltransferase [Rhodocyclaceae bacterium]
MMSIVEKNYRTVQLSMDATGTPAGQAATRSWTKSFPEIFAGPIHGPIRCLIRLDASYAALIEDHFSRLTNEDLRLRFMSKVHRDYTANYVSHIDFDRDVLLGTVQDGVLTGFLHLGVDARRRAEIGVSVIPDRRKEGIGEMLMRAAIDVALLRGCVYLDLDACIDNRAMLNLAKRIGMSVHSDCDGAQARLALAPSRGVYRRRYH